MENRQLSSITLAIAIFSSATYPDTSITSIRSFNGSGIVSRTLAVQMNRTYRSKHRSKSNNTIE